MTSASKKRKAAIQHEIGSRIATARRKARLTQVGLAARSGITRTFIAMLETGRSDMPCATLLDLAKALGVKPGKLLP